MCHWGGGGAEGRAGAVGQAIRVGGREGSGILREARGAHSACARGWRLPSLLQDREAHRPMCLEGLRPALQHGARQRASRVVAVPGRPPCFASRPSGPSG